MKNKNEMLLDFDKNQKNIISKIIAICEENNILLDFHYTSPPLCVLNYPEYNLEYNQLKRLELDDLENKISQ